jgi:hypothetical protein
MTSESPGGNAPTAIPCANCKADITTEYFLAGEHKICGGCRAGLSQVPQGAVGTALLRATGLGLAGVVGAAALWAGVVVVTNYNIGLFPIVVGLIVGLAVKRGASGHRGWMFQTLAMVLTFLSLSLAIGLIGIHGSSKDPQAMGWLLIIVLSPMLYVRLLFQDPISLIFLGIALYEAWEFNRRKELRFTGPYPVSGRIDFSQP